MVEPDETELYEEVKGRRGEKQAKSIAALADHAPRHFTSKRAWRWAEARFNDRLEHR